MLWSRALFKIHKHGQADSTTQMEINKWPEYVFGCLVIFSIFNLISFRLNSQRRQERKPALHIESRSRALVLQDILNEYKKNPDHQRLTQSEQRFRERQLRKQLEHIWTKERSRSGTCTQEVEPVNVDPVIKKISRMNRQLRVLRQPSLAKSHTAQLRLLFHGLCIHTALPFLTFCIFCHCLRLSLIESYLLEAEQESDQAESGELDPV